MPSRDSAEGSGLASDEQYYTQSILKERGLWAMVERKKVQEAKATAMEALRLLEEMEKQLRSALSWGIWDMLGGGFFISMIKRGRVKKAEGVLGQLRESLFQLRRQLGELQVDSGPNIDISELHWFLDITFDNILIDWFTQTKIQDSLQDVTKTSRKIEAIISKLDIMAG